MYNYKMLFEKNLIDSFIQKFIVSEEYKKFAIENAGGNVHLFDFIVKYSFILYGDVIKFVENRTNDKLYMLWNLSQCYKNNEFYSDYKLAEAFKQDLLEMLEDQRNDMLGEKLCYFNDKERAQYWDMIIFDDDMEWCIAITHEDKEDGNRLCMISTTDRF